MGDTIAGIVAEMRDYGGPNSVMERWADRLAALSASGVDERFSAKYGSGVDELMVLAACNGYDAAAKLDGETGEASCAQYPWMYCALTAALTQEQPNG